MKITNTYHGSVNSPLTRGTWTVHIIWQWAIYSPRLFRSKFPFPLDRVLYRLRVVYETRSARESSSVRQFVEQTRERGIVRNGTFNRVTRRDWTFLSAMAAIRCWKPSYKTEEQNWNSLWRNSIGGCEFSGASVGKIESNFHENLTGRLIEKFM